MEEKQEEPKTFTREFRKAPRIELLFDIYYQGSSMPSMQKGVVQNISLGGICIHTQQVEEIGTSLRMRFCLPNSPIFELQGIVNWINRDTPAEMGVQFTSIEIPAYDSFKRHLLWYLTSLQYPSAH